MVVKNGERYFPFAIESVLKQNYDPLEIIVIDGQSIDQTVKLAKSIKAVRYFHQKDQGLANARNFGIQAARGEYISFLDCDDLWAPNKVRLQLDYLQSHPRCYGTITRMRYIIESEFIHLYQPLQDHYKADRIGYTPSTLFDHKDMYKMVGKFDPAFSLNCDADWFARLLDLKIAIYLVPDILVYKRIHDSNLSLDVTKSKNEMMRIIQNSINRKRR
jgi:glycosyltransferase involved in cell wall biosynthesis